ncbi:MAG: ABC transporter permease subunit, partial [Veillonella sp.]|nr:ABC transporter permease subunit [Veillonella sp.]
MHEVISLLINRSDFFLQLLWEHIEISLSASIIAIIIGGLLGVLIHEYKRLSGPVMLAVNFLYTIPSISMLGLLLYVSGVGNTTAVIALVIYALLPMVRNTFTGLNQIKSDMREAGIALGLTRLQR